MVAYLRHGDLVISELRRSTGMRRQGGAGRFAPQHCCGGNKAPVSEQSHRPRMPLCCSRCSFAPLLHNFELACRFMS